MSVKSTLVTFSLLAFSLALTAQTFWFENWTSCTCNQLCTTYTGSNGAWTIGSTGTNGAAANMWYFSYQEQAEGRGQCGSGTGTKATAHIGNVSTSPAAFLFCPTGDCGAAYDASSGAPSVVTNTRLQSPTINCTGYSNITLSFNYIMNGEPGHDYGTVWYYNGTVWALLASPAATSTCGSGQGLWTNYSVLLPASANNNANVQIGFNWQNDANNSGNDPSLAVDSIELSAPIIGIKPVADFTCNDSTICVHDTVKFTDKSLNTPTSWQWTFTGGTPSSSTAQNPVVVYNTPGSYSVKLVVKNSSGSDSLTKTAYINVSAPPNITLSGNTAICKGDSTTITASGGGTYAWSTGITTSGITVSPPATMPYTLVVSNGACKSDTTFNVVVNPVPIVHMNVSGNGCPGTPEVITANGGSSFLWSNGDTTNSITVSPIKNTTYYVTVTLGTCKVTDSAAISVYTFPNYTVCCNATITQGSDTMLSVISGATFTSYVWSPSSGLSCTTCADPVASPSVTTTYVVMVQDDTTSCYSEDPVTIKVVENTNCGQIFVPDAFSPNNDGQNDVLYVFGGCITSMTFQVFDRWGNKVFESNNPSQGWDGKYNGEVMNTGTYVYHLMATLSNNTTVTRKGNITLVR